LAYPIWTLEWLTWFTGQSRDKKPQDVGQIELMAYRETPLVKMAPKLSNSQFVGHQSSLTVKTKQVSTMWAKNPTLLPQYKMKLSNGLTHITCNNKS